MRPALRFSPFWKLQVVVWPAFGVLTFLGTLPYVGLSPHLPSIRAAAANKAGFVAAALVACWGLRWLYSRVERRKVFSWRPTVLAALFGSYLSGLLATAIANATRYAVTATEVRGGWSSFLGGAMNASAAFLAWSAAYFAVRNFQALEREKQDKLAAKSLAQEARLELLKAQVSPHFLFNALSSIHALVKEDPGKAQAAVEALSEFLRYSLVGNEVGQVSLAREIAMLQRYLALEKVRFEDKLRVEFKISEAASQVCVPGFLLHPLVENAIKYGMHTSPMPLRVELRAERKDGSLRLSVANSGRWVETTEEVLGRGRTGVGLKMVRERLEHAYSGAYSLGHSEQDGWVEQVIQVPAQGAVIA